MSQEKAKETTEKDGDARWGGLIFVYIGVTVFLFLGLVAAGWLAVEYQWLPQR